MGSTAVWSAAALIGCVITHLLFWFSMLIVLSPRTSEMPVTSSRLNLKAGVAFSVSSSAGLPDLPSTKYTTTPATAAINRRMRVFRFISLCLKWAVDSERWAVGFCSIHYPQPTAHCLSTFPPDIDARADDGERHERHAQQEEGALLTLGHRHRAVGDALGADRNKVFLLRQPVDRVQEQIRVALELECAVRREVGVADDHKAGLFFGVHALAGRRADGERAFLVLARLIIGTLSGRDLVLSVALL